MIRGDLSLETVSITGVPERGPVSSVECEENVDNNEAFPLFILTSGPLDAMARMLGRYASNV